MTIKAIETEYKGYLFRSRLEARWGVFFDSLGIKWQYETEGYEIDTYRYLPDFFLPDLGAFVEVKGDPQGLRQEFDRLRVVLGPASPLPGFADGITELLVLGDVPEVSYGMVALHPSLSRKSGILARTWGYFVPSKEGGAQLMSDSHQSVLYLLHGKYAWTDPCDAVESKAWDVETWLLDAPGTFGPCNDAYKAAKQARFEHGAQGAR
jgi:hypothetical protein